MRETDRQPRRAHDVLDVLTRVGDERDAFHDELDGSSEVDAWLVASVLAAGGRVSATLDTRRTLIALASLLRSLDAWQRELIDMEELAAGCAMHAAATDRFAAFGAVRADLRTLDELLQLGTAGRLGSPVAMRGQIQLIDGALRDWFAEELFGGAAPATVSADASAGEVADPREAMRLREHGRVAAFDQWSRALVLEDDEARFFSGFAGSCWRNGWVAVPVRGDQLGDDADEVRRLALAVAAVGAGTLVQIDLTPQPRWRVRGRAVSVLEPLRAVYEFDADADGVRLAAATRRASSIITDGERSFAVLERDEHHVVAGTRAFIERYLDGRAFAEAWAEFREYVEEAYADDDPPEHLLEAARDYPRASRRGMGAAR